MLENLQQTLLKLKNSDVMNKITRDSQTASNTMIGFHHKKLQDVDVPSETSDTVFERAKDDLLNNETEDIANFKSEQVKPKNNLDKQMKTRLSELIDYKQKASVGPQPARSTSGQNRIGGGLKPKVTRSTSGKDDKIVGGLKKPIGTLSRPSSGLKKIEPLTSR